MILDIFHSRFEQYVKNAGMYFFTSMFVAIVGIVLNPLMAKNLDPLDYAITGYFTSFNILLQPLLHLCTITFYSRQYYFIPESKRANLENTILLLVLGLGFLTFTVFTTGFYIFYQKTSHSLPFWPYALLAFLNVYIHNVITLYCAKLRITRQAKTYAVFSIIQCVLTQSLTITFVVFLQKGALGKLAAPLIITLGFAVYSFIKIFLPHHFDKELCKAALKFGYPLAIAAVFWYFLSGVDRFYLEKLSDTNALGLYNVGASIAGYMTIFYTTISNTFEPDVYKSIAEGNKKKLVMTMGTIFLVTLLANMFFILFAPQIIGLLTADRYVDSCMFARIFSLHNIASAVYMMSCSLMVGFGFVKQQLAIRVIGALSSIIIYKVLIDNFGFVGAAWGQVLTFSMLFAITMSFLFIKTRKKYKHNV